MNRSRLFLALGATFGVLLTLVPASALPINSPVPTNAYIVFDGLDWAWGNPCSYQGGCGDATLAYQGTQGWAIASSADLALIPANFATYFVFPGANVPENGTDPISGAYSAVDPGGDMACATPYFSTRYTHCDYQDGAAGLWAQPGDTNAAEQLFVRTEAGASTPEPASLVLFGTALGGLGFLRRRNKA